MMEDSIVRQNWRNRWLSSIQEFADANTQHRLWLDKTDTNPHFSFVEYFCCYFDDLSLSDIRGNTASTAREAYSGLLSEGYLSLGEVEAVAEFHAIPDIYDCPNNDFDHEAILADPKWNEVVAAAQRAQLALFALIEDPLERHQLTQPSPSVSAASPTRRLDDWLQILASHRGPPPPCGEG